MQLLFFALACKYQPRKLAQSFPRLSAFVHIAGNYEDRAVATGVVIGASAGAVIGSQNGRTAEGAIIGGIMGAVAGAILANNTYVESRPEVYRHTVHVRQHKP